MEKLNKQSGFTLIELLFVIFIMGGILAVIIPKAQQSLTAKNYSRMNEICMELASYAHEWKNVSIAAQETTSDSDFDAYFQSLAGITDISRTFPNSEWIAGDVEDTSNWNSAAANGRREIIGRLNSSGDPEPESSVQDLIPAEKMPINPFNGIHVFNDAINDPAGKLHAVTGAIACAVVDMDGLGTEEWHYFALLYQGTDNTEGVEENPDIGSQTNVFHSGQSARTLSGLRNGVFLAQER